MITSNRHRRAQRRAMIREIRAHNRAGRNVNTGAPQTAKTHLLAAGVDTAAAARFAPAFSRSVIPTATTTGRVKLTRRSRKTKTVPVKVYDLATFRARLAVYRPKDATAAATFAAAATALAA
ncbi:MAG: hypothetical protein JOZ47_14025 [Kutzneria sp.]|nr:hypothetical protein [Kutzneria sp.]MBV9846169.1 hypothetical protein [Kutzneria sp.]